MYIRLIWKILMILIWRLDLLWLLNKRDIMYFEIFFHYKFIVFESVILQRWRFKASANYFLIYCIHKIWFRGIFLLLYAYFKYLIFCVDFFKSNSLIITVKVLAIFNFYHFILLLSLFVPLTYITLINKYLSLNYQIAHLFLLLNCIFSLFIIKLLLVIFIHHGVFILCSIINFQI